jgi:hypothetical protein
MFLEQVPLRVIVSGLCAFLWLHGCAPLAIRAQKPEEGASAPLVTTVRIADERYCIGDVDFMFLAVDVEVNFHNASAEPIVLDPGAVRVAQTSIVRAGSPAAEETAISLWRPTEIIEPGSPTLDRVWVIAPGHDQVLMRKAVFLLTVPGKDAVGVARTPGSYRLLIDLSTWALGTRDTQQWAAKLKDRGRLWVNPVSLPPILFDVPEAPKLEECR